MCLLNCNTAFAGLFAVGIRCRIFASSRLVRGLCGAISASYRFSPSRLQPNIKSVLESSFPCRFLSKEPEDFETMGRKKENGEGLIKNQETVPPPVKKGRKAKAAKETAETEKEGKTSRRGRPRKAVKRPAEEDQKEDGEKKPKTQAKVDDTSSGNGQTGGDQAPTIVVEPLAELKTYPIKEMTEDGRKPDLKIVCWNVAGLRAWVKKGGQKWIFESDADIICLQETKCEEKKLPDDFKDISGYHCYWNAGEKAGHSGVGLLTKEKPLSVTNGIPDHADHSKEGRTITAEYEKFYLVQSYVPNSGRGLVRLDYRQQWDKDFREYIKKLDETKPVILTGDLNVSHQEIDLKNPKTNKKNAGFTQQERDGMTELLDAGFVDSFRSLYPERAGAYTFWTYMGNARGKNVGWRLDYFITSERMKKDVVDNVIHSEVMGSDHCPISLLVALP